MSCEEDAVFAVVDRRSDGKTLSTECLWNLPRSTLEADVGFGGRYGSYNLATVVFRLRQALRHGALAWPVAAGRHLLVERLMRPLEVVDFAPGIEGTLGLGKIAETAQRKHLGVERTMEAFVLAATLRMVRPTVNDGDAQLEKPYCEPRPMFTGWISPRRTVVDEECLRQAIAPERQFQTIADCLAALIGASLQAQVIAGMIIHDRQRMAARLIAKLDPTLEVHLPQQIRCRHLKTLGSDRAFRQGADAVKPAQNRMHCRECRRTLPFALQAAHNLASPPSRMRVTHRKNAFLKFVIGSMRARMRTTRSVSDALIGLPSAKPFVTRVRVNTEPAAKLPPVRSLLHRKSHKLASLIHYRHLQPWHGLGSPHCQIPPV
jgi:hypothetical protein